MINEFLGLPGDQQPRASQLWIASTVQSVLADAPDSRSYLTEEDGGACFGELLAVDPAAFLGEAHHKRWGATTGILLKLLNSDDRLLVQTHPDKEKALRYFGSPFGKTEAWYVLGVAAGDQPAYIYAGFRPGITREKFRRLIEEQDTAQILGCLHQFAVVPGQVILIQAGLPHAMGENCLVAEIQEPSDITLRAERIRPNGEELPWESLHSGIGMEGLLDCFTFDGKPRDQTRREIFLPPTPVDEHERALITWEHTPCFAMSEVSCPAGQTVSRTRKQDFSVALVLQGAGEITTDGVTLPIRQGTELFLPHGVERYCYHATKALKILECYPPQTI